jgi:SWI/SNF-related matrix-associated actin-dependent regulator 1 of chromatin subfamily A
MPEPQVVAPSPRLPIDFLASDEEDCACSAPAIPSRQPRDFLGSDDDDDPIQRPDLASPPAPSLPFNFLSSDDLPVDQADGFQLVQRFVAPASQSAAISQVNWGGRVSSSAALPPRPVDDQGVVLHLRSEIVDPRFVTRQITNGPPHSDIFSAHGGVLEYVGGREQWRLPLSEHDAVGNAINSRCPRMEWDRPPSGAVRALLRFRPRTVQDEAWERLGDKFRDHLGSWQREAIAFCAERGFRALIGDDPGCGKTLEAVGCAVVAGFPQFVRVLVVCPNQAREQWRKEFLKWCQISESDMNYVDQKGDIARVPLTIIGFALARGLSQQLYDLGAQMLIVDESHDGLRNAQTLLFGALAPVAHKASHVLLLSGTPLVNGPEDLWSQWQFLLPDTFAKKDDYLIRYCGARLNFGRLECHGASNERELGVLLDTLLMVRRLKEDIHHLPERRRQKIMLRYTPSGRMVEMMSTLNRERHLRSTEHPHARTLEATNATAGEKLEPVCERFRGREFRELHFTQRRKALIFAHHVPLLTGIDAYFRTCEIDHILVYGEVPAAQRPALWDRFQRDEDCRVAVVGLKVGGSSLNLTAASLVIFAELWWNGAEHEQAEQRAWRLGQAHDVEIVYLLAAGSADDYNLETVEGKIGRIAKVVNAGPSALS